MGEKANRLFSLRHCATKRLLKVHSLRACGDCRRVIRSATFTGRSGTRGKLKTAKTADVRYECNVHSSEFSDFLAPIASSKAFVVSSSQPIPSRSCFVLRNPFGKRLSLSIALRRRLRCQLAKNCPIWSKIAAKKPLYTCSNESFMMAHQPVINPITETGHRHKLVFRG